MVLIGIARSVPTLARVVDITGRTFFGDSAPGLFYVAYKKVDVNAKGLKVAIKNATLGIDEATVYDISGQPVDTVQIYIKTFVPINPAPLPSQITKPAFASRDPLDPCTTPYILLSTGDPAWFIVLIWHTETSPVSAKVVSKFIFGDGSVQDVELTTAIDPGKAMAVAIRDSTTPNIEIARICDILGTGKLKMKIFKVLDIEAPVENMTTTISDCVDTGCTTVISSGTINVPLPKPNIREG
jgi:hypothetical protein